MTLSGPTSEDDTRPPVEGRYTGRIGAILDDGSDTISSTNSFGRTAEGYLKVELPEIEILDQAANGYKVKYTRLSSKKYSNRNGSQVMDFLRACGMDVRPKTEAELRAALKLTAGRPFQFQLVWEAYNKDTQETISGAANFPKDGNNQPQPFIRDEYDTSKRWFANGKVRYFVSAFGNPGEGSAWAGFKTGFAALVVIGVGVLLAEALLLSTPEAAAVQSARDAVQISLIESFTPALSPRLKVSKRGSLEIYVKRSEFEAVPFPDRPRTVGRISSAWCGNLGGLFFVSVRFRDVRTGEDLGGENCW